MARRIGLWLVALLLLGSCSNLSDSTRNESPFVMQLTTPDFRTLQVRVWPPGQTCQPCDTIIFSHGHNLSNRQYDVLLSAWAEAGYLILAPLHTDSETHPDRGDFESNDFLNLRITDVDTLVRAVIDDQHSLLSEFELSSRYFAAGHSFGALLAQMAGGAQVTRQGSAVGLEVADLPLGVLAISPPGPVDGYLTAEGWSHLKVPQLVVTGTHDVVPLFAPVWNAHLVSFEAGPVGLNFSLVFAQMDHYFNGAFGRIRATDSLTLSAVEQLNRGVLVFANALRANQSVSGNTWAALTTAEVQAANR